MTVLLPLSSLREHEADIRRVSAAAFAEYVDVHPDDELFIRYFLVFDRGLASQAGLGALDPVTSYYNAYYWFRQYIRLDSSKNGESPGLEQWSFRMLENAPEGTDWEIVAELDERAKSEPT